VIVILIYHFSQRKITSPNRRLALEGMFMEPLKEVNVKNQKFWNKSDENGEQYTIPWPDLDTILLRDFADFELMRIVRKM